MSNLDKQLRTKLTGICLLISSGGDDLYWAFQDDWYIKKNIAHGHCRKCGNLMRELGDGSGRLGFLICLCPSEGLPRCPNSTCEEHIGDAWMYEGHHALGPNDKLTIYSKENPSEVVWSGNTEFPDGITPAGIDLPTWYRWFDQNFPATLVCDYNP